MTDLTYGDGAFQMPENKAYTADPAAALDALQRSFADYRETNDARLAEIARRGSADVIVEEKLARIERTVDTLARRAQRPPLDASAARTIDDPLRREHKAAFELYVRHGETAGLKALEGKALSAGSGPDGGFLVPVPAEREITLRMMQVSPIRALATVREISTSVYKKAFSITGPATGWAAETAARPQTNSQVIADLNFPTMELYAMPSATQTILDDAAVDVERWIAEEIDSVFAEQEGAAFVNGDGVSRPQGFLTPAKVANGSWSWGRIGYVPTGVSGALPAAHPSDILVDLVYALKAGFRQNAAFVLNRKTLSSIRKLKATTGEYLWQPPATLGATSSLMNFPVVEAEDMPDIAADTFAIAFGDFRRGYLIVDRVGVRVLRDPFSAKPYVLFYTTKRVGGGVQNFEAIKLLKFGVS
jgi:HK97 family phage major capsid protein